MNKSNLLSGLLIMEILLSACAPATGDNGLSYYHQPTAANTPILGALSTPIPTRPVYKPGELVDYTAQTGDTLPALATHFNTSVAEILEANSIIPKDATTMPPGLPMKIPIYYLPLWGSPNQILPDHAFVNGPTLIGFDTTAFVNSHSGWLKYYRSYVGGAIRTGAQIVDYVAVNFSVSPRLLLAMLEYQAGALSQAALPDSPYPLSNKKNIYHRGIYLQLVWAANLLNNGYYGWRTGRLASFDRPDGQIIRPDPWQNAASVGVQYYFAEVFSGAEYDHAIGSEGLLKTYRDLFGDPWADPTILIPGSLQQPPLNLPFPSSHVWTYTGGPHTGWGQGDPFAAVDFAPPSMHSGCFEAEEPATAVSDGIVVRSETAVVVQDLDEDGDERTGWTIFYMHVATPERALLGTILKSGDPIGYPSCEGGRTTGTHIHIARKYNGEWIPADGALAFNLDGWIAHNGSTAYKGTLTREGHVVTASEYSDYYSQIMASENP